MTNATSAMPELPKLAASAVSRNTPITRLASNSNKESKPALSNMQQIIKAASGQLCRTALPKN